MLKKIVLLGMMGSGKSTLGKILSKKIKIDFFDTDTIIKKECKINIKKYSIFMVKNILEKKKKKLF